MGHAHAWRKLNVKELRYIAPSILLIGIPRPGGTLGMDVGKMRGDNTSGHLLRYKVSSIQGMINVSRPGGT
jgi:hypothetical protein